MYKHFLPIYEFLLSTGPLAYTFRREVLLAMCMLPVIMWPAKLYMKRGLHVHVQSAGSDLKSPQFNIRKSISINISKLGNDFIILEIDFAISGNRPLCPHLCFCYTRIMCAIYILFDTIPY
jgi:hypothetical protein